MIDYYDMFGNPISLERWAELTVDPANKVLARTEVGPFLVSTVWLGLDHGWGGGPPLIFETIVFGDSRDFDMDRYSTREQALAGHEAMVLLVRATLPDIPDTPGTQLDPEERDTSA